MADDREFLSEQDAISRYVRDRLRAECSCKRGTMSRISERTGLAPATLHNIRRGKRRGGEATARVLAEYWGITYAELERAALGIPIQREDDLLPNLSATLEWCRAEYPGDYLANYAKLARKATRDRRRSEWLSDIDAQLRIWASGGKMVPLGMDDPPLGMTSGVQARIKRLMNKAG